MNKIATPHDVIVNTIGREFTPPKLNPPVFKVELTPAPDTNTLKKVMAELAKGDQNREN